MSSISIIGTGNMARTIGALAVAGGNTVEVMGRDQSKAADLAKALGGGATTGEWGTIPAGDIVIVALLYNGVVPVVASTEMPSRARSSSKSATPSIPRPTGWPAPAWGCRLRFVVISAVGDRMGPADSW